MDDLKVCNLSTLESISDMDFRLNVAQSEV